MRKQRTHFEQIPVAEVKKLVLGKRAPESVSGENSVRSELVQKTEPYSVRVVAKSSVR